MILVGDSSSGKTCLIENYLNDEQCPADIRRSHLDRYVAIKTLHDKEIELHLFDATDDENLVTERQNLYEIIDCFLICVSISNRRSWDEVSMWKNEIEERCPDAPIFLITTKNDLNAYSLEPITDEELQ